MIAFETLDPDVQVQIPSALVLRITEQSCKSVEELAFVEDKSVEMVWTEICSRLGIAKISIPARVGG